MPKCINDPKRSYSGTEPSPKGLGYCAHAAKVNTKKVGKDGQMWIVTENSAGTKKWVRYSPQSKTNKKSPLKKNFLSTFYNIKPPGKKLDWNKWLVNLNNKQKKIIDTLIHDVSDELADHNIKLHIVPNPMSENGIYWSDYPWDIVREREGPDYLDKEVIIFSVFLKDGIFDLRDGVLRLQHNLSKQSKDVVDDIFYKYFGHEYSWNKSNNRAIDVALD